MAFATAERPMADGQAIALTPPGLMRRGTNRIQIPVLKPRKYQLGLYEYLDNGGKRAYLAQDMEFWLQPRTLNMVRPQSGDRLKITYWQDGHINPKAYQEICSVLRDVQANLVYRMDTRLIDTLWAAQAFVQRYGFSAPIEITSGYRSPKTNRRLIEQGLPAARNSLHMRGQAADFRMPGLHPSVLGELVQGFKAGGVGFYFRIGTQGGWIHADTGPEREWRG